MDVVRYMLFPLCSREDSERFLRDSIAESPAEPWRSIVRAVVDAGEVVGLCGLVITRGSDEGELWYLVRPERWGRGIATAAVRQLIDFAFRELRLHRVWATCLPENPASARVLEKLGMRKEGFLPDHLMIHGECRSCHLYAMREGDLAQAAAAI